ncbi:MAG: transposase [bacterium]|nr:transposase [bacterium]
MQSPVHEPMAAHLFMTRSMDPEVIDAIWSTIELLLPPADDYHTKGCHKTKVPDKECFRGILIRLVTRSSWVEITKRS